ncbi:MAG TPA: hypothetical protein VGD37_11200 [Kofleriaceae bacterium]
MREAARALDDVSDHLGEVLRRADELLVEWSKFGAQVRAQVERETAAVGEVVEGAVGRAATAGLDRAIGDRLRALTVEIERLEQRTRAASRAVVEQREGNRRILWALVAGIVLANALLVVLIVRRPDAAPVAEPVRLDAASQPVEPAPGAVPPAAPNGGVNAGQAPAAAGSNAPGAGVAADAITGGQQAVGSGSAAAPGPTPGAAMKPATGPGAATRPASAGSAAAPRTEPAGAKASPIALPPRPGPAHPHKKLP